MSPKNGRPHAYEIPSWAIGMVTGRVGSLQGELTWWQRIKRLFTR